MNKSLKNTKQGNAINAVFLLCIFLAEAVMCWFYTNTHDDYLTAGLKTVAEAWDYSIHYGNGRLLGNALVEIFCNRHLLNTLFKGACIFLIIALLSYCCGKFSRKNLIVFFCLVNCLPILFYREVFVWSHGFYNYIPPVVLMLISLSILKSIYEKGKINKAIACPLLIICGFSAQLFSENSTVVNIALAGVILLVFIIEKKKTAPVLINLFSAIAGAAVMVAVPRIYKVTHEMDFYRGFLGGDLNSIIASVKGNIGRIIKYIGDMYPLWILLSIIILIALNKRKSRLSSFSRIVFNVFFSLSFLIFIPRILFSYGIIEDETFISKYVNAALIVIYIIFALAALMILFTKDELKSAFIFIPLAIISVGELVIVHPIGYRCLFITYILLTIPIVDLTNTVLKECKSVKKTFYTAIVLISVIAFAANLYHYSSISKINEVRIEYAQEQIEDGKYDIEIIKLPYEKWLWLPNKSYAYKYTFNHGDPEEMTFSYITYEEYINQHSS